MRKVFTSFVVAVLLMVPLSAGSWYTEGVKVNPSNGTVLAQYTAPANSDVSWAILVDSTVQVKLIVEWIDDMSNVVRTQTLSSGVNDTQPITNGGFTYTMADGDTLRVKVNQTLTVGSVQASLFMQ